MNADAAAGRSIQMEHREEYIDSHSSLEKGRNEALMLHEDETFVYPKSFNDSYLHYSADKSLCCLSLVHTVL